MHLLCDVDSRQQTTWLKNALRVTNTLLLRLVQISKHVLGRNHACSAAAGSILDTMLPLAMKAGAAALLLLCLYAGSLAPVKADFDDVPGRNSKDPLGVTAEPRLLPSMQFNDSWGPKLINTPEGKYAQQRR